MARFLRVPGLLPYREGHALQQSLLQARIEGRSPDTVLLVEHADVFTLGRTRGAADNVLAPDGIDVVTVERGGDVTWHGPGQLVAYPIVKLEGARADLHLHLRSLEDAVIGLLSDLGVASGRDPRNTGVWVAGRKVASIGIACRTWVTWHGMALNVTADLERFHRINPCGMDADTITRLADHLDPCPTVDDLVEPMARHLARALDVTWDGLETVEPVD